MSLSKAVRKRLGTLVDLADQTAAEVIRARGGVAANVRRTGPWANKTLAETAEAAVQAIKIAKDARRLGRKYGGDSS